MAFQLMTRPNVVAYKMQYVFIKFIGTHKQYDAVDAASVDQFK